MFVDDVSDALKCATSDDIAQFLDGRLSMNISQIHGAIHLASSSSDHGSIHSGGTIITSIGRGTESRSERREGVEVHPEGGETGLLNNSLSVLSSGGSRLLGLRNVSTAVFAIVDALASPSRFGRKGGDNLNTVTQSVLGITELAMTLTHFCSSRDTQEMNKTDILVPHNLNLIDESESAEIIP